ncbi:MAG: cobyrinate a,c-diamide synthase [Gammaproteobacteria bacterium]|nr:cobyrinate a,c-diamide synthase [Gammaproteobacteria bacterium]NIR99100.1 cobyrinate a,c-diamide synthase [Gammaproteobacteria bacterium]NIT64732.1 cobyrinate a,c-diamide synthase [Gammaproteobacteria bacterium]NIV21690.1 cobyrinate a,c-diamide synthase [Gammaproteobacteria bacterium]NIX10561.1 cobyrinate a,c-diamide synthase [Gammaproteobacteria bacterium]
MPHVLISAAHKSSGKTTLTLGLCAALRRRGQVVQPLKKGPDYIDPMWLARAAGRECHNLDFHTQREEEILATFSRAMSGADVALIEGNKGLYDGLDLNGSNSNAALAALLGAPVVLVLDARGMTRGVAPLILGHQAFDPGIRIAGVILNKVGGARHEAKLRAIIEHYTDVKVLGAVHQDTGIAIAERHLGLIPTNESTRADEQIRHVADAVARQVDLEQLLALADEASLEPLPAVPPTRGLPRPDVRIGIARDSAFGFYYPGDLEALRAAGAELVELNTLRDTRLPRVDGLFIGGGFPETHMGQLESNDSLRAEIRNAIEDGMPAYAECGGLMYLARTLVWGERRCEMVGAIPGDVRVHERPQGRGYARLRETSYAPWRCGGAGSGAVEINAHEFHYSSLENLSGDLRFAYEVLRGTGVNGRNDGIVHKNLLANYVHLRDVDGNHWAWRFVDFVRRHARAHRINQASST